MIHIIEGRIGSGKTYWCVAYVLRLYYDWDDRFFQWFPKKDIPKIITNIKGINIGTVIDLNKLLDASGSLDDLFYINPVTYELRHKVFENSVIIIDEAQSPRFFPRMYKSAPVMLFFQLHRHFGAEVFMTTQDVKSLCPDLRELPEYHLRCVRQSLQLGRFFTYRKYYDNEPGATSRVKRDTRIFDCYKSAESGITHKKVPSALTRYIYLMAFCLAAFIFGGYLFKNYFFGGNRALIGSATAASAPVPIAAPAIPAPVPAPKAYPVYGLEPVGVPDAKNEASAVLGNVQDLGLLKVEVILPGRHIKKYEYDGSIFTFVNDKITQVKPSPVAARSGASEGASKTPVVFPGDLVKNTNNSNTDYKNNIRQ